MNPKAFLKAGFEKAGYQLRRLDESPDPYGGYQETFSKVKGHTKTSRARVAALCDAVRYIVAAEIPGSITECGVWRGGSMMACAIELLQSGDIRPLYLYDTFYGMVDPTTRDVRYDGSSASEILARSVRTDEKSTWSIAELDVVKQNMISTGYPERKMHFVQGRVQDTIPGQVPESICILRLDTDWYESTKHGLEHLFPRISSGGVLIIDDYGHWQGVRDAVDEFLALQGRALLLHRIDYAGRIAVIR